MVHRRGRDADAHRAWAHLAHLFLAENRRPDRLAAEFDLTPPDVIGLLHLQPGKPAAQRDLADDWHCDASWVTTRVDRLEELGLVERHPHPGDRRIKTVDLTPHGAELRAAILERFYQPPEAFDRLTAAELHQLVQLLDKLGVPAQPFDGGPRRRDPFDKATDRVQKAARSVEKARRKVEEAPRKVSDKLAKAADHLDRAAARVDEAADRVSRARGTRG